MQSNRWLRGAVGLSVIGTLGVTALGEPSMASPPNTSTSGSTSVDPYVIPVAAGVEITSMLTVNDPTETALNGYDMVGLPDGMGGYVRAADGRIVLNVNHEVQSTKGIVRKHGQKGAFVSRYIVNPTDLTVRSGTDLTSVMRYWDYGTSSYTATVPTGQSAAMARLCSGTTAAIGQLFNAATGNGTNEPIHFAGEENGAEGRAFGALTNGVTKALPRLGLFSWENAIPAFNTTDRTVVMGTDDQADGRIAVYMGTKRTGGDAFYNAGLTNGALTNVWIAGGATQTDAQFRSTFGTGTAARFHLQNVGWNQTGAAQAAQAGAAGVLRLNRIEDGAFDPANPNDFYFLTTDGGEGATAGGGGGLWLMRFDDIENPRAGGSLTLLLDGTEAIGFSKPDNMAIDQHGNLIIQEDPGNIAAVARIVAYRISDGAMGEVATFDPALFDPAIAGGALVTQDEESSGIFDAEDLRGPGWFFFDAQAHTANGLPAGTGPDTVEELVELGQLLAMHVDDWASIYTIPGPGA